MSELQRAPSTSGLAPNLAGALAYFLGPITGILFLVIEKESAFVRFHAMQSIVVGAAMILASIALSMVGAVLAVIPVIGWMIGIVLSMGLGLASLTLWFMLMLRAFQGHEWELPVAGT